MSRCYPYPPPGYARRANVELGLSPKKEKHKRKDKKKKQRKDSQSNGDLPLDLDKRSKKGQQTGVFKDFSLANGSVPERTATSSEAVLNKVAQTVQAQTSNDEMLSAVMLAINCKGIQTISKQGSQFSLVSDKSVCSSNGTVVNEAAPSASTYSKSEVKLKKESDTRYTPCVEKVWSTLDDQEWLFHHNNLRQSGTRTDLDKELSPQVWAEAVLLPSVGIYALPYVVPD